MRTTFLLFALTIGYALSLPGVRQLSSDQLQLSSSVRLAGSQHNQSSPILTHQGSAHPLHQERAAASLSDNRMHNAESLLKALKTKRKNTFISLLAVIAGMADVVCYKLIGFYANMMTGNTIRVGTAIVDFRWAEALFFGSVIVSYSLGAALLRGIDIQNKKHDARRHTLVAVAPVALAIFCLADLISLIFPKTFPFILALGFGLINAASLDTTKVVTNAASGHWQSVGLGLADAILLKQKSQAVKTNFRVLFSFLVSIIFSSAAHYWLTLNPWVRLPPVGVSFGVLYATLLTWYATCMQRNRSNLYYDAVSPRVNITRPIFS